MGQRLGFQVLESLVNNNEFRVRFYSKTKEEGDCLIWTGSQNAGCPIIAVTVPDAEAKNGRRETKISAIRVAYYLNFKRLPTANLRPNCGNPLCLRPDHLEERTSVMQEADRKITAAYNRCLNNFKYKLAQESLAQLVEDIWQVTRYLNESTVKISDSRYAKPAELLRGIFEAIQTLEPEEFYLGKAQLICQASRLALGGDASELESLWPQLHTTMPNQYQDQTIAFEVRKPKKGRQNVTLRAADLRRFWSKIRQPKSGCWIWSGEGGQHEDRSRVRFSFVTSELGQVSISARQLMVQLIYGYSTQHIQSKCNNAACVKPKHLVFDRSEENCVRRIMSDSEPPPSGVRISSNQQIAVIGRVLWSNLPTVVIEEARACYLGSTPPESLNQEFFEKANQISVTDLVRLYEFVTNFHPHLVEEFAEQFGD